MKLGIDLDFTNYDLATLQEVLSALLRHLELRAVRTNETQQGRKHGVVTVEVESTDAPWSENEED